MIARIRFAATVTSVVLLIASVALSAQGRPEAQKQADPEVVFNVESRIYHRSSCSAARRCTKNCIVIALSEARKRGGRACQICGGPATASAHPGPVFELQHDDGAVTVQALPMAH